MGAWLWITGCWAATPAAPSVHEAELGMVSAQQQTVRAAERGLLMNQAQAALDAGDTQRAAVAVRMGLEVDADAFAPYADFVAASAESAQDHALLVEVFAGDPDRARRHEALRDALAVAERWHPSRRVESLGATDGVTRPMGTAIIAGVLAEYVIEPHQGRMHNGAQQRIDQVADAWGINIIGKTIPNPDDPTLPVITTAIEAGLPESVAVVEGVSGALAALDPYTRAVWPADLTGWEAHHGGYQVGAGLQVIDRADAAGVVVEHPVPGGPAWAAGVRQLDVVVAVNEGTQRQRVVELGGADEVAAALVGELGSEVTLELLRGEQPVTVPLVRAAVPAPTVSGWRRQADNSWDVWLAEGVALVRISAFREQTDEDVRALLEGKSPRGVVLDLRGNGGGDVSAAVNVADLFVADGQLAHLAGRTATEPELAADEVAWNTAIAGDPLEGVPVVVLVDGDTASAAEILAGSLRERAGAVLVGDTTYGKGLSQALRSGVGEGFAWQVTNLMWTLPSGAALERPGSASNGLAPDRAMALTPAERFQVAVMRRQREALRSHADGSPMRYLGTARSSEIPPLAHDPHVLAALIELDRRIVKD